MIRAEAQGGAISYEQLRECGVSHATIQRRRRAGHLHNRHVGVYALGRPGLTPYGKTWAASLAAGGRGSVTGWSAAAHLGLNSWPARPELLVIGGPLRLHGVRVFRTRRLDPGETRTDSAGLRFTAWPRMVTDLAARSTVRELQDVLDMLERKRLLELAVLDDAIVRARGRRGLRKLGAALEPWTSIPEADYRSLLERFSTMVVRPADLPSHEVNGGVVLLSGPTIHVDLLFRSAKLAVEVDGRDTHTRAAQFETDRRRDRELQKLGYRVLRFTWRDVRERPEHVLRDIRAILAG